MPENVGTECVKERGTRVKSGALRRFAEIVGQTAKTAQAARTAVHTSASGLPQLASALRGAALRTTLAPATVAQQTREIVTFPGERRAIVCELSLARLEASAMHLAPAVLHFGRHHLVQHFVVHDVFHEEARHERGV